jgi:3-hydroxybutyryl-CoA dehydrogenase
MTNVQFENYLINFGFGTKEEKKKVLKEHHDKKILMDLSCYNPREFYEEFPQLKGTFAALFSDEEKKVEIHFKEAVPELLIKMRELNFKTYETSIISCGFVFPRTIVQIINEAYYALEEEVASKIDIDRAMKFGVNYPKGPFEWAMGKELYVVTLLNELWNETQDRRYKIAPLLSAALK